MSFDNRGSAVDGNSGNPNPEMQPQAPSLCKAGCGFYGNPVQEGLCSKCYKDKVKCLQQDLPSNSAACASSTPAQSDARSLFSVLSSSPSSSASPDSEHRSEGSGGAEPPHEEAREELQTSTEESQESLTAATSNVDINSPEPELGEPTAFTEPEASSGKPKKNRCLFCNKKVGLTGFGCRCGGLFCSAHRYSDMHGCKFDYKEHAQDQIRKNNPVVVGKKITKI